METVAKIFFVPARQNQFIQENIFNNAPVRRIAIAKNTKSAYTGSYTQKIHSGTKNLISDKSEYLDEVN